MYLDLKPNEVVIKAGDSNHLEAEDRVNGKLVLTNQRIYFITTKGSELNFDHEIEYRDIREVMVFNTMKIFPNGLNIITKDGKELKFVVKKRNNWCEAINRMY